MPKEEGEAVVIVVVTAVVVVVVVVVVVRMLAAQRRWLQRKQRPRKHSCEQENTKQQISMLQLAKVLQLRLPRLLQRPHQHVESTAPAPAPASASAPVQDSSNRTCRLLMAGRTPCSCWKQECCNGRT